MICKKQPTLDIFIPASWQAFFEIDPINPSEFKVSNDGA